MVSASQSAAATAAAKRAIGRRSFIFSGVRRVCVELKITIQSISVWMTQLGRFVDERRTGLNESKGDEERKRKGRGGWGSRGGQGPFNIEDVWGAAKLRTGVLPFWGIIEATRVQERKKRKGNSLCLWLQVSEYGPLMFHPRRTPAVLLHACSASPRLTC